MDSFISKFFRQSSHYALGELLIFAAGFISFPILTRALTLSDYGVMSVYSATLWIFMAFSRAGLSEASVRFFPEYGSKDDPVRRATFFSSLFTGTVGIVIPLVLVILLFGEKLFTLLFDKPMPYLHLLLAGQILANTLYTRTQSFWRAEQRSRDYTLALVISRYFILLISLAFLFFVSKTLISFFVGTLIAELLIALFLVILFFREAKPSLKLFSGPLFRECLQFGLPLVGYELGYLALKSADRYILQFMLGAESVGIFSVASNMAHYTKELICVPLLFALMPIYLQIWHEKGKEETIKFVSLVANYAVLLVLPIFFCFVLLRHELITILASDKYAPAAQLLPWIVAGTMISSLLAIYGAGLYIAKKTRTISLYVVASVGVDIALNFILIHYFGMLGSCYAHLIVYSLLACAIYYSAAKTLPLRIQPKTIGVAILASAAMLGTGYLYPDIHGFVGLVFKAVVCCGIYGLMVFGTHRQIREPLVALAAARLSRLKIKATQAD